MTRYCVILLLNGLLASVSLAADAPKPTTFKAGFAERDITPDLGMEAPGGYGKAYHKTLHDPCKVRASVFDDGHARVAVVGVDALGIRRDTVQKAREAIAARTGIPAGSILIAASHSHSSGPIVWTLPGEYDFASDFVKKLAYDESTCVDPKYLARVESALVEAVVEAHDKRVSAKAGAGKGSEATVAFNRRFFMKGGGTATHPGLGNPEILKPAGPVDPEVGVIGVWDTVEPDKLLGCIVNFACHATTSPGGISANYIYYLEKVIQGYYGKDAVVVFLAGASGDVTQVDNQSAFVYPSGDRWAQRVGGKVGAEALKVLLAMEPGSLTPVASRSKIWMIPRRAPAPERVEAALAIVQGDRSKVDPSDWTFAKETVMLDALIRKEPNVEVEVQALQVGPVVLVSDPAEYFCRYGLEIKQGSGFALTFPVSLANGCVGYVPSEEAFDPAGGGYETRLTSYSNLVVTAGTQMRDVGIELARQLNPGALPEPARRPLFKGKPWPYGNIPPQVK